MGLTGQPKLRELFLKRYGNGGKTRLLVLLKSTSGEMERMLSLGRIIMMKGISEKVADNKEFASFITHSLQRHSRGDRGDLSEKDKKDFSLKEGLRIFSMYHYGEERIWIVTETDRSAITVSLLEEY